MPNQGRTNQKPKSTLG